MDLNLAYQLSIVAGVIIFAFGVSIAIKALKASVLEIELLREIGDIGDSEDIIGSPVSSVVGAIIAGLVSATIVGLYGVHGFFMFLGPLSAFVSAIGVIVCFMSDLRDAKEVELKRDQTMGGAAL